MDRTRRDGYLRRQAERDGEEGGAAEPGGVEGGDVGGAEPGAPERVEEEVEGGEEHEEEGGGDEERRVGVGEAQVGRHGHRTGAQRGGEQHPQERHRRVGGRRRHRAHRHDHLAGCGLCFSSSRELVVLEKQIWKPHSLSLSLQFGSRSFISFQFWVKSLI
jgi:hypothetical protein